MTISLKKILSLIMTQILIVSVFPMTSSADNSNDSKDGSYEITGEQYKFGKDSNYEVSSKKSKPLDEPSFMGNLFVEGDMEKVSTKDDVPAFEVEENQKIKITYNCDIELIEAQISEDSKQVSLIRKINMDQIDEMGRTNAQRIIDELSPLDESGIPYELHHVGQSDTSPLAILKKSEHIQQGNNKILHWKSGASEVNHGTEWNKTVKNFWKDYLDYYQKGLI